MELNNEEVLVVAEAVSKAQEVGIQALIDMQLVYVGGGIGETTL